MHIEFTFDALVDHFYSGQLKKTGFCSENKKTAPGQAQGSWRRQSDKNVFIEVPFK